MGKVGNQSMKNEKELMNDLALFNGSESIYSYNYLGKYPFFYTDGIKYIVKECKANWLLSDILTSFIFKKSLNSEEFLKITVIVENRQAKIIYDDGNDNVLYIQEYEYTDFPLTKIYFYFENRTLCLPSER